MQSRVENDLAEAKRRWTEKKIPGNFKLGKQNPSNLLFGHERTSGLHYGIN